MLMISEGVAIHYTGYGEDLVKKMHFTDKYCGPGGPNKARNKTNDWKMV